MKDLNEMDITELKALAFDAIVTIEQQQNNLKVINQKLNELITKANTDATTIKKD